MNKNKKIAIGLILLIVVIGGLYASMNGKDEIIMAKDANDLKLADTKIADEEVIIDKKGGEIMTIADETSTVDKNVTMMKVGSYEAYSADKLARAETGDVVLFFYASWCPSCRGLNASIESNLKSIPEGVTILKTDYDKETELKKKYGVTYQHTLVQVDKDGNLIKKWSGGSDLDKLLSQIQ